MPKPKILLVAGHANIRNLTGAGLRADRDVDALRGGTGAHGEVEWTGTWASLLRDALNATGLVEARATDATYSPELYAAWNPDLVIAGHYHRDPRGHAAIAAPDPAHGYHDLAAQLESSRFAARWAGGYEVRTGVKVTNDVTVTDRMTDHYVWCYIDAHTAAVIAEYGNANDESDRQALYEPAIAHIVTFDRDCVLEHFDLKLPTVPVAEPPRRRASDLLRPPYYAGQSADLLLPVGGSGELVAVFEDAAGAKGSRTVHVKAYDPGRYVIVTRPLDADGNEVLDQRPDATHVVDVVTGG